MSLVIVISSSSSDDEGDDGHAAQIAPADEDESLALARALQAAEDAAADEAKRREDEDAALALSFAENGTPPPLSVDGDAALAAALAAMPPTPPGGRGGAGASLMSGRGSSFERAAVVGAAGDHDPDPEAVVLPLDIEEVAERMSVAWGRGKAVRGKRIVQVKSAKQRGMTCGYYSVFNALTLNDVLRSEAPFAIAPYARHRAEDYGIHGREPWLQTEEVTALAANMGLENVAVLGMTPSHGVVVADLSGIRTDDIGIEITEVTEDNAIAVMAAYTERRFMPMVAERLRASPTQRTAWHFVCNIRDVHWVLVTAIKQPFDSLQVLVMDSNNKKMNNLVIAFAAFVHDTLAPLVNEAAGDDEGTSA